MNSSFLHSHVARNAAWEGQALNEAWGLATPPTLCLLEYNYKKAHTYARYIYIYIYIISYVFIRILTVLLREQRTIPQEAHFKKDLYILCVSAIYC